MGRRCIWIVRYGLTEHPLVEGVGPFDSDIDPKEGIEHAKAIAQRIASAGCDTPRTVYCSPFLRTTHTAHIISQAIPGSNVKVEQGLWEWLTPSLLVEPNGVKTEPRSLDKLFKLFPASIDATYMSVNPIVAEDCSDIPEGAPHFVESEQALLERCSTTLSRLFSASSQESLCIVSHAPCDQAIALQLEGAVQPSESQLGPWPLGGITMFSSTDGDKWVMELYGDTTHMPGMYKPGIKEWSLPCLASKSK